MKALHKHRALFGFATLVFGLMMFTGCGEDWEVKLKDYVEKSMVSALKTAPAQEIVNTFCRRGDLDKKIFSVRSFEGRLCNKQYVKGLDILGGVSLFLCWDGNYEEYQTSSCAEKAMAQWGQKKDSFSKEKLMEAMKPVMLQYLKETEEATGDVVPYYPQVKFVVCLFDASLFGPGEELHSLLCSK